jgi:hypothetical protein
MREGDRPEELTPVPLRAPVPFAVPASYPWYGSKTAAILPTYF